MIIIEKLPYQRQTTNHIQAAIASKCCLFSFQPHCIRRTLKHCLKTALHSKLTFVRVPKLKPELLRAQRRFTVDPSEYIE